MSGERGVDRLKAELRALVTNSYMVSEKVPPRYDRKWKLHVLFRDGSARQWYGDDTEAGQERILNAAIGAARARHAQATGCES